MAGNHEQGLKARETNKRKYGDNYYIELGKIGGKHKGKKGFACMSPERLRRISIEAGKKGGLHKHSTRKKNA